MCDGRGVRDFRNEDNKGIVYFFQHFARNKKILNCLDNRIANHSPIFLIKKGREPIRARGFEAMHTEHGIPDFNWGRNEAERGVFQVCNGWSNKIIQVTWKANSITRKKMIEFLNSKLPNL